MNNDVLHNGNILTVIIKDIQDEDAVRQSAWPGRALIAAAPPYDVFTLFPGLMEAAFSGIPSETQRRLLTLCRVLSNVMHNTPDFLEGVPSPTQLAERAFGFQAALFEASASVASLFGDDEPFWSIFRAEMSRQVWCNVESDAYGTGLREHSGLDLVEYEHLTRARYALARVCVRALARFANVAEIGVLLNSLDEGVVAIRLLRDLRVWKTDLRTERPNFVIAELARLRPDLFGAGRGADDRDRQLAITLHGRGVAGRIIDLALDRIELAYRELVFSLGWRETLEVLEREARKLRGDLLEILDRPRVPLPS